MNKYALAIAFLEEELNENLRAELEAAKERGAKYQIEFQAAKIAQFEAAIALLRSQA